MDQESNRMEQHPVQCRNGCGFYSNAGTDGLCSVCYKDLIKKKQQPPTGMPASLAPSSTSTMASLSIDESSSSNSASPVKSALETATPTVILPSLTEKKDDSDGAIVDSLTTADSANSVDGLTSISPESDQGPKEGKKKKNRCLSCKKKVGLTGFTCRCGGLFCSTHRYSDKHDCQFDYRELGAEEIRKSNPVIVAEKVQKI